MIALEVMINAAGLAFVAAGSAWHDADGQEMFLFVLVTAAAEVSVGLAVVLLLRERLRTIDIDAADRLGE
jgi:NADH-quinone oxidoreductase subunit K